MSAVPARPRRPERCSSVAASSAGGVPTCSSSQSTSPGSMDPERVAMTNPSSGVKPIVVSTERPPSTAARDAPAPRWQVTMRSSSAGRPTISAARREPSRRRDRGSRTCAAPSACATPAGWRRSWQPAACRRGRRCRSKPPPAHPAGRPSRPPAPRATWAGAAAPGRSARGGWPRHRHREGPPRGTVSRRGRCGGPPPRAPRSPRWPGRRWGYRGSPWRRQIGGVHQCILPVQYPELEAAGARVDDEDAADAGLAAAHAGHAQSRISGASSPSSRV